MRSVVGIRRIGLALLARWGLAGASGLLLALSAPPSRGAWLAWVALVPFFFAVRRARPALALALGSACGIVFYSLAFQWTAAFHRYALIFVSTMSGFFFVGLPTLCVRSLVRRGWLGLVAIPSVWVLFEYVKQSWFLSFPFGILGYTQFAWVPLVQVADTGGVLLVSWLIVLVNALVYRLADTQIARLTLRVRLRSSWPYVAMIAAVIGLPLLYGYLRLATMRFEPQPRLKVAFAQTLFPPRKSWNEHQDEYLASIERLATSLGGLGPSLILFPELAVDRPLSYESDIRLEGNAAILNRLSSLSKAHGTNLLFGSLELRTVEGSPKTYNSMHMFDPEGNLAAVYRKTRLVPFGEENPFEPVFPGLSGYLRATTDSIALDKGDRAQLFSLRDDMGSELRFGVMICFESCFGSIARDYALRGADFIVSATSDYWSQSALAMYQHAVMSVFRAIETRRPVLRISNGGFSCYVDERGRYSSALPIFREGAMTSRLYVLQDRTDTAYVILGDWLVALCASICAAYFVRRLLRRSPGPRTAIS